MCQVPLKTLGATCEEAVQAMRDAESSAVVILNAENKPAGILTEQDVARRITFNLERSTAVSEVMTAPVQTIAETEFLFHAIAVMRRNNIRHMPVFDQSGSATGLLRLKDALFSSDESLMKQIDLLTQDEDVEGFKEIKQAQVDLAAQLMDDNVPVPEILALLTQINSDIYHRVTDCTIMYMQQSGNGSPPVDFSVIVMVPACRMASKILFSKNFSRSVIRSSTSRKAPALDCRLAVKLSSISVVKYGLKKPNKEPTLDLPCRSHSAFKLRNKLPPK